MIAQNLQDWIPVTEDTDCLLLYAKTSFVQGLRK